MHCKLTKYIIAFLLAISCFNAYGKETEMTVLTPKQENIVRVSATAAQGNQMSLKSALSDSLDARISPAELKEILVQVYAYCGFPRSLNALNTLMTVLKEKGYQETENNHESAVLATNSLERGTQNQTKLVGQEVKGELFEFAPAIDAFLKAHLFGDIFERDTLDWQTREVATIAMLAVTEGVESQLNSHIAIGQHNGLTSAQTDAIIALARQTTTPPQLSAFPLGEPNDAYAQYFSGRSWLAPLSQNKELNVPVANVTFEPGCRNNWHSHTGGQVLIAVGGIGYYQERGQKARRLVAGDIVEIPANVEHWHGAAPDSWFAHLAVEANPQTNKNTWLEPVSDDEYAKATAQK